MPSALIFGGSGQLGSAVSERLLSAGWDVWVATRDGRAPPGAAAGDARWVDGTGRSRTAVIDDIGRPIDAVFDPTAYDEADARDLLQARTRFGGLVVVSSASVYAGPDGRSLVEASQTGVAGMDGPISEDTATVPAGDSGYARRKVALERTLLESATPVSILRPCAVYGLYSTHPREWWLIKRALDGRTAIPVAYGGRSIFHTSSARACAHLAATCMERPGQGVLNVADAAAPSVVEIAAAITAATGLVIPVAPFRGPPVGPSHVGSTPWSSEHPFVLDTARARSLGWRAGDYRDEVAEVCEWVLRIARTADWRGQFSGFAGYGYDPFDYGAEDDFLATR